jgi:pyruvate ferredoxin oxidoreductase gamma subunit
MIEIRVHGRGGQGGVTLAELVALAAIEEGMYGQSMPSFGPERRGAPILAFLRISDEPILIRAEIDEPDVVVVLDPSLLRIIDIASGLKENGTIVINTRRSQEEIRSEFHNIGRFPEGNIGRLATVNATAISKEILGLPITNTTMIGALIKATDIVALKSLFEPMKHRFGKAGDKNIEAMEKAYEETCLN